MQNVLQMSDSSRSVFLAFKERQSPKLADRCTPTYADIFWLRFERYFEDIDYPFKELYGDPRILLRACWNWGKLKHLVYTNWKK